MNADLEALRITAEEIERLSGVDVGEIFVGGILGGVYRPSVFKHPQRLLLFALTEVIVIGLLFTFTMPITLFLSGNASSGIKDPTSILQFLQIAIALTALGAIAWNLSMRVAMKRFKPLMALLDEIDRYNQVLEALHLLNQLEAVQNQVSFSDRAEVLNALRTTRENLVTGLLTEKILRESRGLLASRYELLANIEQNLATLQTIEMNYHATEYRQLLREALQISVSVHREVQQLSRMSRS